jgi:hypothetical protein
MYAGSVHSITGEWHVRINCRGASAAPEGQVVTEVQTVLGRRSEMKHPPVTLTVSDAAALGIAQVYASPSLTGQVFERFLRTGTADSRQLIDAAQFEQGFASAEGYAALYCLVLWARAQEYRRGGVA